MRGLILEIRQSVDTIGLDATRLAWMRRVDAEATRPVRAGSFTELQTGLTERSGRVAVLTRIGTQYLGL